MSLTLSIDIWFPPSVLQLFLSFLYFVLIISDLAARKVMPFDSPPRLIDSLIYLRAFYQSWRHWFPHASGCIFAKVTQETGVCLWFALKFYKQRFLIGELFLAASVWLCETMGCFAVLLMLWSTGFMWRSFLLLLCVYLSKKFLPKLKEWYWLWLLLRCVIQSSCLSKSDDTWAFQPWTERFLWAASLFVVGVHLSMANIVPGF